MIDQEFIERATKHCEPIWNEYREKRRLYISAWNNANREFLRECIRKYSKTDKGRYASSKRNANRHKNMKDACEDLHWFEKKQIGKFYRNCPPGYEVDHIIPVSRGGKHILSNLQYLTKEQNLKKSNKLQTN